MDIKTIGAGTHRVVALHGIQGTNGAWMPVVEELRDVATWILPNLRGRGKAKRAAVPDGYGLLGFVDDLCDVVDSQIGADEPWILAGWSMGVSVALEYLCRPAVRRPTALVLLSGTPCLAQVHWFISNGEHLLVEAEERARRLGLTDTADLDAVAFTWTAIRHRDQRSTLGAISEPTLVIHGEKDSDCPVQHGHWLAGEIGNGALKCISGAGHSLLTQNTKEVAREIRCFIKTLA